MTESKNSGDSLGIRMMAEKAKGDYFRLHYHIMPEYGWMNDPNGLIQFKGKYHAFFQHYPYAPKWELPMHWGHVVSDDLVHWEYLPIALVPDQNYETGCFSGSAVDNNGELTLVYTADNANHKPMQTQCVAFSKDGIVFEKYERNPVIYGPPEGYTDDFRDPKVFRHGDKWYLVAGSSKDGKGCILLYSSGDLINWTFEGQACKSNGEQGLMWECPDLFELDGTWVLVTSPMKMKNSKNIFITGVMDFNSSSFIQKNHREIDLGPEFYAAQTFKDDKNRRILIAWMNMWGGEDPTKKNSWAGALTFPRELFIRDGEIWQKPVDEIQLLRKKQLWNGPAVLGGGEGRDDIVKKVKGDCLEISFTLPAASSGVFKAYLRASADLKERTVLSYDFAVREFTVDITHSGNTGGAAVVRIPNESGEKNIPVHILVDRSSVEFFLCGGKYAVTNRIFPHPESVNYDFLCEGSGITLPDLEVYELS